LSRSFLNGGFGKKKRVLHKAKVIMNLNTCGSIGVTRCGRVFTPTS